MQVPFILQCSLHHACTAFISQGSLHHAGPSSQRVPYTVQVPFILQGSLHHAGHHLTGFSSSCRFPSSDRVPVIRPFILQGYLHPMHSPFIPLGFPSSCIQGPFILQGSLHHAGPSCYRVPFIMQDPSPYRVNFVKQGLYITGFPSPCRVPSTYRVLTGFP